MGDGERLWTGHVWKTVSGGAAWTNISSDLPNVPTSAIVYQRGSREIDIGTDIGVFALPLGTTSWLPLAAALPNVPVTDLVYDGPNGRLIAGTHGRGMFALATTSAVLRGNITNSGTLSALDAQQILTAVVGLPIPAGSVRFPNGDANCDGNVTAVDALLVLSKVVGLRTPGTASGPSTKPGLRSSDFGIAVPQNAASSPPQRSQYHSVGKFSVPHSWHLSDFMASDVRGVS